MSIDHPICLQFEKDKEFIIFKEECLKTGHTEEALAIADKKGYNTNLFANHPFVVGRKIPIFIANFVLTPSSSKSCARPCYIKFRIKAYYSYFSFL